MPSELDRIDCLRLRDADDVPSATLTLAMCAMPVTMDPRPWEAVYGVRLRLLNFSGGSIFCFASET